MVYSNGRLRNIRHNMSNARHELGTGGFGLNSGFPRIEIGSKLSIPRGAELKLATLNLLTFALVVSLNLDTNQPFPYDLSPSASLRMHSSCISNLHKQRSHTTDRYYFKFANVSRKTRKFAWDDTANCRSPSVRPSRRVWVRARWLRLVSNTHGFLVAD